MLVFGWGPSETDLLSLSELRWYGALAEERVKLLNRPML